MKEEEDQIPNLTEFPIFLTVQKMAPQPKLVSCLKGGFGQEEDSNDIIGDNSEEEVRLQRWTPFFGGPKCPEKHYNSN